MQEIDVVGNIAESKIHFMLNTTLWDSFDSDVYDIRLLELTGDEKIFPVDGYVSATQMHKEEAELKLGISFTRN